jgi:soluble lytic murein transglycosylase-like protein
MRPGAVLPSGAPLRSRHGEAARGERGQTTVLLLGVAFGVIAGVMILGAFGQALGAKGRHQRAADLSAVSAARAMRDAYPRLFEPPYLRPGVDNPRHLERSEYVTLARVAAVEGARRNGARVDPADVDFDDDPLAPTRVTVRVRGRAELRPAPGGRPADDVKVDAKATAELSPPAGAGEAFPATASGGGYSGPLAYRQGKPMRPDVALAFDRMEKAARADGVALTVNSGFRSDAEQARLFAANPNPKWVARPGTSLHRLGTELDIGPPTAYGWLAANAPRFGFVKRYSWEPWHWGYTRNPGTSSVGYGRRGGDGRATKASAGFVPPRYAPLIARAAQRWSVGANLLAAQIYAESGFNPFARSPAGALGIAQFMPGTARAYGLRNPFDPAQAIDAQAHLMHDLLRQFASVPLALAAYNAGPGAVSRCGCIPPYPETRAYVAKILGLLGGAGDLSGAAGGLEVRLVE